MIGRSSYAIKKGSKQSLVLAGLEQGHLWLFSLGIKQRQGRVYLYRSSSYCTVCASLQLNLSQEGRRYTKALVFSRLDIVIHQSLFLQKFSNGHVCNDFRNTRFYVNSSSTNPCPRFSALLRWADKLILNSRQHCH